MSNVFESNPHGTVPYQNSQWVRERVREALGKAEWTAIGALYPATSRRTKRDVLHAVLKEMLATREIHMRTLPVAGARDRTEFKRAIPKSNQEVSKS